MPEYGYSKIGTKCFGEIDAQKPIKKSFLSALSNNSLIANLLITESFNADIFCHWFEKILLPLTKKGTTFILDNASIHPKKKLAEIAHNNNCYILFLPPYSPDLNPIELVWGNLKMAIRRFMNSFKDSSFDDAFHSVIKNFI